MGIKMDIKMDKELELCKCGSAAHMEGWPMADIYIIKCDTCSRASFPTNSIEKAIKSWNETMAREVNA